MTRARRRIPQTEAGWALGEALDRTADPNDPSAYGETITPGELALLSIAASLVDITELLADRKP